MTREIPLTQGRAALVDDEDFERLSQYSWHAIWRKSAQSYLASAKVDGKGTLMHRMITDAPDGLQVDHRDHDGLNNRRSNLRLATPQQNMGNCRRHADGSSGYKGVSPIRGSTKWQAGIRVNGKRKALGRFANRIEAALAYDEAAVAAFGEFAMVNFPRSDDSQ